MTGSTPEFEQSVNVRDAVRASLRMLAPRDRRKLALAALLQMATSMFDVIGVMLLGLVASLGASALSNSAPPAPIRHVTEALGMRGWSNGSIMGAVGGAACGFLLAKSGAALYFNRRVLMFLAHRQTDISTRLFRALLARPLLEIQARSSQLLIYALIDGINKAALSLLGSAVLALTELAMLIALGVTLFVLNPVVTLAAVAFFGVIVMFMHRSLGRRMAAAGALAGTTSITSRTLVQEALGTYREIWVLDRRENYAERVAAQRALTSDSLAETLYLTQFPKYALDVALVVGALALTGSQFLWADAQSAIGTVTLFLAASTRVLPSILRLQQAVLNMRNSAGAAIPTYELVRELLLDPQGKPVTGPGEALTLSSGRKRNGFRGSITARAVTFTYSGSKVPALVDVSFQVPAGASLALVGPSGAGKSTLADVIMGVLTPDRGSIELGGVTPRQAISEWPGSIAYVPQSVYLADGTIRENVALGLQDELVDNAAVWKALARAQLDSLVEGLPLQLDTPIGENGARLSGGQRQRLGLARALYTEPTLLVMDEATSALDTETEHEVTRVLQQLSGEVTMVVIAHRLSTVLNADLILYLEEGRLVSSGTFSEVRANVERFDRQAQLSGL